MKDFLTDIYKSVVRHDLLNLSANISFFAILALLPLAMIFVSILGYLMGSGTVVADIVKTFADVIPGASEIVTSNLKNLIGAKSSVGIWGVSFLILIATVLFSSVERAFDTVFHSQKKRHFYTRDFSRSWLLQLSSLCWRFPPALNF